MGEVTTYAFSALLLLMIFALGRLLSEKKNWDHRRMRRFSVRGVMQAKTITGNDIEYLLVALADPEDRAKHLGRRLYTEEGQQEWLRQFNRHIFLPTMAEHDFFFAQTWMRGLFEHAESGQQFVLPTGPWGMIYQAVRMEDGTIKARMNPGGDKISEIIRDNQTRCWGCRAALLFVEEVRVWSDELAERNYKMLTPADIAAIQEDNDFRWIEDRACTLARYRALEAERQARDLKAKRRLEPQTHVLHDWLKVQARWSPGSGIILDWTVRKWPSKSWGALWAERLLGFRREGQFVGDGFVDQENGVRILDTTSRHGESLDVVAEGQTYYYTFVLRGEGVDDGAVIHWGPLRFTFFAAPEVKEPLPEPEKVSPVLRHGREALRNIGDYMQTIREVERMRQQDIEEINGMKLPEKEKQDRILQLTTVYTRVLERLQSHVVA